MTSPHLCARDLLSESIKLTIAIDITNVCKQVTSLALNVYEYYFIVKSKEAACKLQTSLKTSSQPHWLDRLSKLHPNIIIVLSAMTVMYIGLFCTPVITFLMEFRFILCDSYSLLTCPPFKLSLSSVIILKTILQIFPELTSLGFTKCKLLDVPAVGRYCGWLLTRPWAQWGRMSDFEVDKSTTGWGKGGPKPVLLYISLDSHSKIKNW